MVETYGTQCHQVRSAIEPAAAPARQILIIEDNVDAAETLAMLLEFNAHHVTIAYDGAQGLERASECSPEVVICDIGLPGDVNGYGVARALKARSNKPFLIAMTGYDGDEDRHNIATAGFDVHLVKPVDPVALEHVLCSLPHPSR
jgi:CheY-like chemotaxis protein